MYQISTFSRGWFVRNALLNFFSRVHATGSVHRLKGFPSEERDETRWAAST